MNHSNSSGAAGAGAVEWEDSAGEMDSEDNHAATVVGMGMGMMEVDADAQDPVDVLADLDRHPGASSSVPVDADFFNSFPDDFDDQDLS